MGIYRAFRKPQRSCQNVLRARVSRKVLEAPRGQVLAPGSGHGITGHGMVLRLTLLTLRFKVRVKGKLKFNIDIVGERIW